MAPRFEALVARAHDSWMTLACPAAENLALSTMNRPDVIELTRYRHAAETQ
jgi:hypothetical protein